MVGVGRVSLPAGEKPKVVRSELNGKKSMICLFHSSSSKAKDNLNNKRATEEKM